MTASPEFPKPSQKIQCLIGRRLQTVTVKTVFTEARELIAKVDGASQDPRGSFIVADLQGDTWVFRHSLSPEQAGEAPLTEQQKQELQKRIDKARAEQAAGLQV